jgi:CxxC motif-containing protein (DUF1111 family)
MSQNGCATLHLLRRRTAPFLAILIALAACERPLPTGAPPLTASLEDSLQMLRQLALSAGQPLGSALPFLTPSERQLFDRGNVVFQTVFTPATGLGPTFNDVGCAACHQSPVVGATGEDVETHATAFHAGVCDDLVAQGGPIIQDSVTPALRDALKIDKEPIPRDATGVGRRTTPLVLGFGLLDAVPDAEILAIAELERFGRDGIHGRPNWLPDGRIGRFGRKAQVATLREFVAGAFVGEMGVTDPESPVEENIGGLPIPPGVESTQQPELSQADLDATNAFMQLLAPPPPVPLNAVGERGGLVFFASGCAGCHSPFLVTGPNRVPALSNRLVSPFTDLLLHDMGPALADICRNGARPQDFRTEPLMGLHVKVAAGTALLHDGRAATIEQAIALHAGEATRARNRFLALSPGERAALLTFLKSL